MDQTSELRTLISAVRRRWFRQVALRAGGRATAAAAIPIVLAVIVDLVLAPSGPALVWFALAVLLMAVGSGAAVVWRLERRPDDRRVARFIEEHAASASDGRPFDDALVSAVDVIERPVPSGNAAFAPLILAEAARRLRGIEADAIVEPLVMRRASLQAIGGVAALVVAIVLGTPGLRRAIETARVRYFPGSIHIVVTPGNARVAAGTSLRIRAALQGAGGELREFAPSLTVSANGQRRTVAMSRAGNGFEYTFESIDRSFQYLVAAGAAKSAEYSVTALFAPKVRTIELRYDFPAFSGLPPRHDADGGDIYGPAGTRVSVRVHTDKPIANGALALGSSTPIALATAGERVLEGEMVLRADDSYRVKLADADGLQSLGETEYFIRLMDDRPPDVRILRPAGDQPITPLEEVTIEARADDDYGIAAFDLVYAVGGGPERVVKFDRITGTNIQKIGARLVAAEELGVKPGDVITYYARARDVARGKRSTEAKSDLFFLEVKPFAEEFVAAQSQAGAGASATQIDSLVEAQKDIITATWNIERRSQGGRSSEDVKAVAQAQAELKARVEQMGGRPGPARLRAPAPERAQAPLRQPPRGASGADPMGTAVDAMHRALQQLQEQKTKEAIPHEMAALNSLLKAQAEVRRQQVTQSASGGGGWGNRQGQDLSALFDKELQRQQRTNYETRSQVEERPDERGSSQDAADRIRDLAKRQEDLSRRQRELASARMSQEEMQRQLEKLTREQTELRQQAEDLARELSKAGSPQGRNGQQQASSGRQNGKAGGQQSGSQASGSSAEANGMREASEEMRSAASELGRENPEAAAARGRRAADQLRQLEQQMRTAGAQGSERAAGELQAEAQQIAQEQRRIAAETARLQQADGGAASEAARRLAGEKDRLAGRVDELQRSAERASQQKGADSAALADAARDLGRERIGQRMRDSAKQMREPGEGQKPGDARTEQQLAQALDRIVDKLGTNASAETRQLSERLNQTREIRDRLNSLERQIRDAEARQRGGSDGRTDQGRDGQAQGRGQQGATGPGTGGSELQRLQQEYQRELQRAEQALGQLGEGEQRNGLGGTPEQHEFSRSAPGTEGYKQDRSGWESLRKNVDSALEKYEASVSDRLARARAADRFSAGGSDRVPESYRRPIAKYFEALAKAKQ